MKCFAAALLLAALCASPTNAAQAAQNPISRIVGLLKGLAETTEKEGKVEEDLYETYVCWAKTVIDTKTKTNAAATSKIEELNAYISDIEGGRVEFTDERGTLTKELEEVNSEIEAATALREKEEEDFASAEEEMNQAITALASAIQTLKEATKDHKEGELLQQSEGQGEGFAARVAEAKSLERAVELGEKFLTKGDSLFLKRLLTGDVPNVDWKKLNRKAGFKMKYKARSGKIQDLLAKLHDTFKANLKEATDKDTESGATFTKLMTAKNAVKSKTEKALGDGSQEAGARGEALEESKEERDDLTTQKTADEGFITQTTKDLALKKKEWGVRSALRTGELAAISKAIGILHSDEARDIMKKSFDSQGFFFLQVSQGSTARAQSIRAADVLRNAGKKSQDRRLTALASRLSGLKPVNSAFDEVIAAIDKMITTLKGEEKQDFDDKELCENDRMTDARDAIEKSRTIDEESEDIMSLEARIAEISAKIKDQEEEIAGIQKEVKEATTLRGDEQKAWEQTDSDDKAAAKITGMAIGVLEDFYSENNLMLVQKRMAPVVAGDAPPPPPPTWEAPYGGKTGESTGIIAILNMVKEDIEKDCEKAKEENDEARTDFLSFKTKSEAEILSLQEDNTALDGEMGDKQVAVKDNKAERSTLNDGLKVVVKKMKDAEEGCDYITINYPLRLTNRQIELDGLDKAKAILNGAAFGL